MQGPQQPLDGLRVAPGIDADNRDLCLFGRGGRKQREAIGLPVAAVGLFRARPRRIDLWQALRWHRRAGNK